MKSLFVVLIASLSLNSLLIYNYFKKSSILDGLNVEMQNMLADNIQLKQISENIYERFVKVSEDYNQLLNDNEDLQNLITEKEAEIVSTQRLVINLKNQLIESWTKLDEIKSEVEDNSIFIPFHERSDHINVVGNITIFFNKNISSNYVRQNILKSKIKAIFKYDPMEIFVSIVKENEGLKGYVKLYNDSAEVEIFDSQINLEALKCGEGRSLFNLSFGYSPIAGVVSLGFDKWSIGVINTFSDNQQSYMIGYRIGIRDIFNNNITGLIF